MTSLLSKVRHEDVLKLPILRLVSSSALYATYARGMLKLPCKQQQQCDKPHVAQSKQAPPN